MFLIRSFASTGLLALGLTLSISGHADEGRAVRPPLLPKHQQECAACHVAYAPTLLPAESWQRLMRGLPNHFGTDASLDAASVKQISAWLTQHAATGKGRQVAPPEDRITRSAWFQREHHEISPRTWQLPKVKGATNCLACHARANQGVFDEHEIRIPY